MFSNIDKSQPMPVTVWSKAVVCLWPLESWARMFVCCVCCVLFRQRPLRRADRSSRGVLPDEFLIVYATETSTVGLPRTEQGCCAVENKKGSFVNLFRLIIRPSSRRCSYCRPKHVGENIVNKMHHKFQSAFVVIYIFQDTINAPKNERIEINKWSLGSFYEQQV